jgi:hypothetical protein
VIEISKSLSLYSKKKDLNRIQSPNSTKNIRNSSYKIRRTDICAKKPTKNAAKKKIVPKVAQICEILGSFGCFLPGNKDSDPCLEDPVFLSLAKKGQRVGSLNPNPWIRNNTTHHRCLYTLHRLVLEIIQCVIAMELNFCLAIYPSAYMFREIYDPLR